MSNIGPAPCSKAWGRSLHALGRKAVLPAVLWLAAVAGHAGTAVATQPAATQTASKGLAETQRGRGKLLIKGDSWDFGHVAQNVRVSHEYLIQNVGTDTLFMERIRPTCGCTTTPPIKDRLAPGEQIPVEVTFSTGKFSGHVRKTLQVISSDAVNGYTSIELSAIVGELPPSVGLAPESGIRFDRLVAGQEQEAKATLTNLGSTAATLRIVGVPPSYLEARLSGSRVEPGKSTDLLVKTRGGVPHGAFSAGVTVQVDGRESARLTIPVSGVNGDK